ncbi:hypothetical protein BOTBODRAFT_56260 [Botryobasidium botryosum FD-172 SS1]|uniref:NAD-dependent epimerase/dehydratase domain-containing protein n=1 Tax=Botryobasidium botryosum (strain FD-172 SS1) TaxID=930990 RepID=A0A067MNN2_BOTB1|nr:hypothetical protein BOTBODRAFT_56260 [Botryobasidium botryosum FD-172 SS1]
MAQKPTVLVLGGLNTCSRALASFLVPDAADPLVSHLRIVDKYSINPPTTYLGRQFSNTLKNPIVDYKQANLINPATVKQVFDPPDGHPPYSYVFDFTGEIQYDRTDPVQIKNTTQLGYSLGVEAAKRKVAAYVRLQHPFYDTPLEKRVSDEKDDPKPSGVRGVWWHETLRALAAIKDLNLVIVRPGSIYGPHVLFGIVTPRIIMGAVYKYLDEEMKYLYVLTHIRINTVHVDDVSRALWAVAKWIEPLGREAADRLAGEKMYFANEKGKVKDVEGVPAPEDVPVAPLFNLVDDSDSTQSSMGQVIANVFGIKFGFHGLVASTMMKLDFRVEEMIGDVNEKHMEAWTMLIHKSDPPVPNTPLTAYVEAHMLAKYSVAYAGKKIKEVVGFELARPKFDEDAVREVVGSFREEGTWPNLA